MLVKRDPFARQELHRETVPKSQRRETCRECGGEGRYIYRTESDGGRTHGIDGRFCGVDCMRNYHGVGR